MTYELRRPSSETEWAAYHRIRRHVLFELRGLGPSYDANHPDETRSGNHPLLLLHVGSPVGVIRVDLDQDRAIFRRVAVREDVQRQGHGRALIAHAEAFARGQGCVCAVSHVDLPAEGFYVRCGFTVDTTGANPGTVFMTKALVS